jgi:hypothetical protein
MHLGQNRSAQIKNRGGRLWLLGVAAAGASGDHRWWRWRGKWPRAWGGNWDSNIGENRAEAHRKSGSSWRWGSSREEQWQRRGPKVDAAGGLVRKLHGVALVLAEDGAGQTLSEVGRRLGGALAVKKTVPVVRRQLGAEAVARRRGGSGSGKHRWWGRARALV